MGRSVRSLLRRVMCEAIRGAVRTRARRIGYDDGMEEVHKATPIQNDLDRAVAYILIRINAAA